MNKKCYRYFGGLLTAQERWLNRMAGKGWRLIACGKLCYTFAPCRPGEVEYRVEFVAHRSHDDAMDYRAFLEDVGYRVFVKNINLSLTLGKVRLRPWAERGGRIATKATTYDRELLIVEKAADGGAFALHTTYADQIAYTRNIRNAWLYLFGGFLLLAAVCRALALCGVAALALIPVLVCQAEIGRIARRSKTEE